MAYLRYRRKSRRTYAKSGRKSRSRSARPSRYTGRTRRYTKRRPMSKRSILNLTSRKKRDTMLAWSNTVPGTGAVQGATVSAYAVNGTRTGFTIYAATARDLNDANAAVNNIVDEADRTATTCYMRGLAENLRYTSSTGKAWLHRRICVTARGPTQLHQIVDDTSPVNTQFNRAETSNGWVRAWLDINLNNSPNTFASIRALLFKGTEASDWTDLITAQLDTRRLDVKFDRTFTIRSGNESGILKERKLWHPMNKNLVYDDDEAGGSETTKVFSVADKRGMGDYFIIDIFQPAFGATSADILRVDSQSSLYWHEK
uniref:Capsid protein n=1 Tax=Grus nigricollis-associatied genomovirus TaxID=3077354 RepID=A0AAF0YYZ0_9VIRU|nr:MAG: capsid protein [Grus nigricollis-associatied genomovirus]